MTMRRWRHFGARSSARHWLTLPNGRRTESDENFLSLSRPITTGAGSTALWGTNHLWISKQLTTNNERTDSTKLGPKNGGKGTFGRTQVAPDCSNGPRRRRGRRVLSR